MNPSKEKLTAEAIRNRNIEKDGRLTMLTAYDAFDAKIAGIDAIDMLLVGDSVGTVKLGFDDVSDVTCDHIIHHTAAVRRGAPNHFIAADVPFKSMIKDGDELISDCRAIVQSGADAVKIECGLDGVDRVKSVLDAGIDVIGHLGYTPQSANQIGRSRVQGRTKEKAIRLLNIADALESAGCFCLLCELVPRKVGKLIADQARVPVIGIGAGVDVDGQVLVLQDMLGLSGNVFKFARTFADLGKRAHDAVAHYAQAVREGRFPGKAESFLMKTDEWNALKEYFQSKGVNIGNHPDDNSETIPI